MALDDRDRLVGYSCRKPTKPGSDSAFLVGPLYADSVTIARDLLAALCDDIKGQLVEISVWSVTDILHRHTHSQHTTLCQSDQDGNIGLQSAE